MNHLHLASLSLFLLCTFANAQTSVPSQAKPTRESVASREVDPETQQRRSIALSSLQSLAIEARSYRDEPLRARVQAHLARVCALQGDRPRARAWADALAHDRAYPDDLAILFETGYLKPPPEAKSLVTGRPYVYVAAGEKSPSKANDRAQFDLLYDDDPIGNAWFDCAFASGVGGGIRVPDLNEQLKRRGR